MRKDGLCPFIHQSKETKILKTKFWWHYSSKAIEIPCRFPLASGSSTEIPLNVEPLSGRSSNLERLEGTSSSTSSSAHPSLEGLVTIHARGKRDSIKRSFFFEGEQVNDQSQLLLLCCSLWLKISQINVKHVKCMRNLEFYLALRSWFGFSGAFLCW